jgi:hypothetical protein
MGGVHPGAAFFRGDREWRRFSESWSGFPGIPDVEPLAFAEKAVPLRTDTA